MRASHYDCKSNELILPPRGNAWTVRCNAEYERYLLQDYDDNSYAVHSTGIFQTSQRHSALWSTPALYWYGTRWLDARCWAKVL